MRRVAVAVALATGSLALAGCGTQSQVQALRGWIHNASFTANSTTLRLDIAHATTALTDAAAPATELHTVCGILTTDAEAANSSLPTPDDVGANELSTAYAQMGTAANTCYYAAGQPTQRRLALGQLATASQELALATWQVRVGANLQTDASATAAWSTETAFPAFVHHTETAISALIARLQSPGTPAVDGAYCRAHPIAHGAAVRLLPAPDAQASTQIQTALDTLAAGVGTCAAVSATTTGPTRPVIAAAIAEIRHAGQLLFFANQRVQIATQS